MDNRYCSGCGRAFAMGTWQKESFCGSCGWPLKYPPVPEVPPEIRGYPDVPRGRSMKPAAVGNTLEGLRLLARHHPLLFGTGTIVLGAGAIMLAPTLIALGHGVMVTGLVVAALGRVRRLCLRRPQCRQHGPRRHCDLGGRCGSLPCGQHARGRRSTCHPGGLRRGGQVRAGGSPAMAD
jgi:hypothetical protein